MFRVSIELWKHQRKFGRTKNAVGTLAAAEVNIREYLPR